MVIDQHRWPPALHRRVTGIQTRLITTIAATAATVLRRVAPIASRNPPAISASAMVPRSAAMSRRDHAHRLEASRTTGGRRNSAVVATGAAMIAENSMADGIVLPGVQGRRVERQFLTTPCVRVGHMALLGCSRAMGARGEP